MKILPIMLLRRQLSNLLLLIFLIFLCYIRSVRSFYSFDWITRCFLFSLYVYQSNQPHGDLQRKYANKLTKKVVFVKTHKTGSTTLQSIFFRLAAQSGKKVALPTNGKVFFNQFQTSFKAQYSNMNDPDMLLFHMNFNKSEVSKLIPRDENSFYVTILRDIPSVFESRLSYYKFKDRKGVLPLEPDPKSLMSRVIDNYQQIRSKISGDGPLDHQLRIIIGNWYYNQFNQKTKVNLKLNAQPHYS